MRLIIHFCFILFLQQMEQNSHPKPIKICNIIQSTYKLTSLKNNPEEPKKKNESKGLNIKAQNLFINIRISNAIQL